MTLRDLKHKWAEENNSYLTKEVGSGVQKFVKDALKSEDIFNLKEGLISTLLINRRDEFIEESSTKASRRADIVIYINPEIIIPVEVEKFQNINAGLGQLFQYQLDLDKKYGILTDGYTWQFYNNTYLLKEFTITQIINNTELFNEFWEEYIKPEFYYLSFFEKKGQLKILPEDLSVEKRRQDFFRDITTLIRSFKNKLQIEGYLEGTDKKERERRAIELTYAYIIQFILYKTLVDNNFDDFAPEFENIVKKIHGFLKDKRYKDILGGIEGISSKISKNIYRPFTTEQEFIRNKIQALYHSVENNLSDVSPWLDIFIFIKKYNFSNVKNDIFGYIYENYLKELYEESKKGQYFTDPAIVNFMLNQIGYQSEKVRKRYEEDKDSISIIDPACGSGTFLYSATDSIVKAFHDRTEDTSRKIEEAVRNSIFGLDIEEFPLYLAEMNILMRMLPLIVAEKYNNPIDKKIKVFITKDSIAEFTDTSLRNTANDIDVQGGQLSIGLEDLNFDYKSYVREEDDLKEMKKSLENQSTDIPRRRFDYVIGNPPYIGYNECSKQKILIFERIKQGKDALNNIYGMNLHSIPEKSKKYAPKPNLYAFFIALGIALLKDKGKLCYIIPQTILTAGELDVLRYHLSKFTKIEKIITFSGKMFIGRGIKQNKPVSTSSLILVLNKELPSSLHEVEVINYDNLNDAIETTLENVLLDKKATKKKILQTKLYQNIVNWNFIKHDKAFLDFYEEYKRNSEDVAIYYNHVWADLKFKDKFYFDGSFNIPTKDIIAKKTENIEYWEIPYLRSGGIRVATAGFYPKKEKIKIAQGSQGMAMLDTEYKVIWRYINPDKFFYIEGKNVLPRFQQFCIASNKKDEILYLLSILNSQIVSLLLEKLLKSEQEKDVLMGISVIKEFVRVPKITEDNDYVKNNIVLLTQKLLDLEKVSLSDLVDFSKVLNQKFDKVSIDNTKLVLQKDDNKLRFMIKNNYNLVKKSIDANYPQTSLGLEKNIVILSELMALPIIDFEKQKELKNLIDDLVFCLYFNIDIPRDKVNNASFIKELCEKNKFYKLVS